MRLIDYILPYRRIAALQRSLSQHVSALQQLSLKASTVEAERDAIATDRDSWIKTATRLRVERDQATDTFERQKQEIQRLTELTTQIERERFEAVTALAKFDHDGDGKPGGSRKRGGE